MLTDDLITFFAADPHSPLTEWIAASPRFAAFATTYRDKIRKKLRTVRDDHSARDVLGELYTAYLLLQERRITVAYEPYSASKERAPDLAVRWTTRTTFNVEVTRMRVAPHDDGPQSLARLAEIIAGKLGQMLPGMPNVLLVFAPSIALPHLDVQAAVRHLQARVEQRDERLFSWYGWRSPADVVPLRARLSAVIVRSAWDDPAPTPPLVWHNAQTKHPVSPSMLTTLLR